MSPRFAIRPPVFKPSCPCALPRASDVASPEYPDSNRTPNTYSVMTVSAARHNDTEHPDMARCDGSPPVYPFGEGVLLDGQCSTCARSSQAGAVRLAAITRVMVSTPPRSSL